jgi:hypothetical protein
LPDNAKGEGEARAPARQATYSASTNVYQGSITLREAADQSGLTVDQRIALGDAQVRQQVTQGDLDMRQRMARGVGWTFGIANGVTLLGVAVLAGLDQWNMVRGTITTADRIVDQKVVMTLIGATTVQVGAIAFIIARYLFPAAEK